MFRTSLLFLFLRSPAELNGNGRRVSDLLLISRQLFLDI